MWDRTGLSTSTSDINVTEILFTGLVLVVSFVFLLFLFPIITTRWSSSACWKAFIIWKKVLGLAWLEAPYLVCAGTVAAIISGIHDIYEPLYYGKVFDFVTETLANSSNAQENPILAYTPVLRGIFVHIFVLILIKTVVEFVREYFCNSVGDIARVYAQKIYFKNTIAGEVEFFDVTHTSELNKNYQRLDNMHYLAALQSAQIAYTFVTLSAAFVSLLSYNLTSALVVFVLVFADAYVNVYVSRKTVVMWLQLMESVKVSKFV